MLFRSHDDVVEFLRIGAVGDGVAECRGGRRDAIVDLGVAALDRQRPEGRRAQRRRGAFIGGQLVGINTAIYSRSGGSMGIGFAIPVTTVKNVMDSIIATGQVVRGYIGVEPQDITPEVLQLVEGIPTLRGYASPPAGIDAGLAALAADPQGGALLSTLSGSTRTIVGTSTKLYEGSGGTWTDRSRGGNYSIGGGRWRYVQFGNTSLAINLSTVLQSGASGASFADVSNAPKAALMEAAAGFVMLANTDDSGLSITGGPNAAQEHRWWCSQIFNPTGTWAPSVQTQATTGLLVETPGAITALKRLGNDIVAYKGRSIYVGQYVGSPEAWQWRCVPQDIGCLSNDAVINAGTSHYFIGDDDVYVFDGTRPYGIGEGIRNWFFSRLNRAQLSLVRSLHDRANGRLFWWYPSGGSSTLTSCLVYHILTKRWGHFDLTVLDVMDAFTSAVTYDTLTSAIGSVTYDGFPGYLTYDDPFWIANTPILSYFNTSRYLTNLSTTRNSASLRTGWFGSEEAVTTATRVRPRYRVKASSASILPRHVMGLGDMIVEEPAVANNGDRFDVLQSARYHQFDISFTGAMEVEAIVPTLKPMGAE